MKSPLNMSTGVLSKEPEENKESLGNTSKEIAVSNPNEEKEEPPQDSDIHQLIEECSTEVYEEQTQEQEVENVVEQLAERRNLATILSTKEPEHLLSMGYEHLSITPKTEFDEVTESNAENLLPIPSECEVTLEDKRKCDVPISENSPGCDNHSEIFSDSKNNDDILVYDDFEDIEYVEASLFDPEIVNLEEENKLLSITRLIFNIESLNNNPIPDCVLNFFVSDNSLLDNFSPEFKTFCDHTEETRSGNTTHADNSLPEYDSFFFEIEPDRERLINILKSDILDDSSKDSLSEEADLFLAFDNSIPPGIENIANDSEGDIRFLEDLLIDDSILSYESSDSNFEDNPSVPRPPQEPPDAETDAGEEIPVVMNNKDKFDEDYYFFMFDMMFSFLSAESEDTIFDPDAKTDAGDEISVVIDELECLDPKAEFDNDDYSSNRVDCVYLMILERENLYNCDPNAYSFDNSNYLPRPLYKNYLCNLCGNNSNDGYACQQQFSFVYEQEPSYNQNYDGNYYSHESPSFPCCDNGGGSHETFQCQPMAQNIDFSGFDQIQTPQYPDVHPPSKEMNEEVFQAKGDLMKSIQTFLENFICIPFEEKPPILFQAWEFFFAIQYSKPENPNELFQKLLKDLKELVEYDNSPSRDRPIFFTNDENHSYQNKESLENTSKEIVVLNPNEEKEEPPQDSDIHLLIEECSTEVCEEQKQSMEDTMLELVKICQEKEFLCIHDNVDDLIESALNTKLLSINSIDSQRLDKKEQEVKNVVEQPAERKNRIEKSLQNFRVIHKSSFSLNTSQIYSIHAVATILSTKEPEHLLSMGYEHLSITPETESDEVIDSNAENLLPITSKCEVTLEDKKNCDVPISKNYTVCDNHSEIFSDSKNDDDILVYDDFKDIKYVEASLSDPEIVNVEEENVVYQKEEEERLINVLKSDISDDSSNDSLSEEANLFLASDNSIPPGIENIANDSEGDIRFLEELLIDDYILSHESSDSNFEDNPSVPRPPSEPPDAKTDAGKEIPVVMNNKDKFDEDYYFSCLIRCFLFFPPRVRIPSLILDLPPMIEVFLCWIFVLVSKIFTSFDL
uniref:Reverse transcriptase domain-containing protein n=1 Tax=Tanacetum cinerariifolium TaxID=118510 RepID=A0A699HDZ5_TANCI|nr:hypothetical protein [Tanacetum cinerariifolium]